MMKDQDTLSDELIEVAEELTRRLNTLEENINAVRRKIFGSETEAEAISDEDRNRVMKTPDGFAEVMSNKLRILNSMAERIISTTDKLKQF